MLKRLQKDFHDAARLKLQYETWDHSQTSKVQLNLLKTIWTDCITDIPYYSGLVERGEAPSEIRSWADFQRIPELNREILQSQPSEFVRRSGPPELTRMTGGSTGNPIRFGVWHREDRIIRLLKLTLWQRAGHGQGDRLFLIWGHSHLLGTGWRRSLNHLKRKLKDRLLGYRRVDAYRLDPSRHREIARALLEFRPTGLMAYASALDSFVRANQNQKAAFRELGLRFVMPCAEPSPKQDSLELLRSTFGCPVVQEFGGVDFGQVASQYDDEPFFVFPDQNVLEAEPTGGNESGQAVLVTTLYPRYLPLIRYRQGDLLEGVVKESHGHVRAFKSLKGRINDMIRLPSGAEVHSVAIFHCIHHEPSILNIQMLLENTGFRLKLATLSGKIDAEVEARIRHRLGQVAPELGGMLVEPVFDVETTRAGKRRWFVDHRFSEIPS